MSFMIGYLLSCRSLSGTQSQVHHLAADLLTIILCSQLVVCSVRMYLHVASCNLFGR